MKTSPRSPRSAASRRTSRQIRRTSIGNALLQLEDRLLMAADVGVITPIYQNQAMHGDVDGDAAVTMNDLKIVADQIRNGGPRALVQGANAPQGEGGIQLFLDVNGDNYLSPADLALIGAELRQGEPGQPMVQHNVQFFLPSDLNTPITTVEVGQEFVMVVTAEDIRLTSEIAQTLQGVIGAYADVNYTASLLNVKPGTLSTLPNYGSNNVSGGIFVANDASVDGFIDNAGGTQTDPINDGPLEAAVDGPKQFFVLTFIPEAAGVATVTLSDANPGIVLGRPNPTTLFHSATNPLLTLPVTPPDEILYGGDFQITIVLPPVLAQDDFRTVTEGDSDVTLADVRTNDIVTPPAVAPLIVVSVGADGAATDGLTAAGGTVTIVGGQIHYTPPSANFFGPDSFNYLVRDTNNVDTDIGTVFVTVDPVNDPPTAVNDAFPAIPIVLPGGGAQTLDIMANDWSGDAGDTFENPTNDPIRIYTVNGQVIDPLVTTTITLPSGAEVTIPVGALTLDYNPDPGGITVGGDTFVYTIIDSSLVESNVATVDVTIGVNAVDDFPDVQFNSLNNPLDVIANDVPGFPTTSVVAIFGVTPTTTAGGGTISILPFGAGVIYTPANGFFGTDTFIYDLSNGFFTDTAVVTVYVNRNPTAQDDSATVVQNSVDNPIDVLVNDSDAPDNDFPVFIVTPDGTPVPTTHGSIYSDGAFIYYTPAIDFVGIDTFNYTISDGHGGTASALVTVNVTVPPSSIVGYVFGDDNNDGFYTMGIEQGIGGVTVTIIGTDVYGTAVNTSVLTDAAGAYTLTGLQPGTYTITETDPLLLIDGKDQLAVGGGLGAAGTSTVSNDQYQITIVNQVDATGFNFGERGREAAFINISDFRALSNPHGLTFGLDLIQARTGLGQDLWYAFKGAWMPYVRARLFLGNDYNPATPNATIHFTTVTLTVWDAADNAFQTTFPYSTATGITNPGFHAYGFRDGYTIVRFDGPAAVWNLLPYAGPEGPDDVDLFFSQLHQGEND